MSGYPTGSDLRKFLPSGLCIPEDLNLQQCIDSVVAEWEGRTGFSPFLATDETAEVRSFDPPSSSRDLSLRGGLVELNSLTVSGTVYTRGQNFELYPVNAPQRGKPYTSVRFYSRRGGLMQSIKIDAVWGFTRTLPANVRTAILSKGAVVASPDLSFGISKGLVEWKEGDLQERYAAGRDAGPLSSETVRWETNFEDTLRRGGYRRVSV